MGINIYVKIRLHNLFGNLSENIKHIKYILNILLSHLVFLFNMILIYSSV